MKALNSVIQTAKWLANCPRRCGACLFDLGSSAKPLGFDVDPPVERVFWESDTHTTTMTQLRKSARRGCTTCAALLGFLQQTEIQGSVTAIEWYPSRGLDQPRPRVVCHIEGGTTVALELCAAPEIFRGATGIMVGVHPSICPGLKTQGGTGEPPARVQAAHWLADCRTEHSKCRRDLSSVSFVPTRLLSIGGNDLAKVVICERFPAPVMYGALSHRWSAETEAVKLTRASLGGRKTDGILMSALPPLMQDSITVLRELGIEYVWIDSLCIVQDSLEDWRVEAAMMAQVYSNAELTVAATWCHGSGQSLFSRRNDSDNEFAVAHLPSVSDRPPLFIRRAPPHFQWTTGSDAASDSEPFCLWPLLSRGWVYQEQWLSRRILHFTRHELVWVCNETTACECAQNQFGTAHSTVGEVSGQPSRWQDIVHEYSSRAFTQVTDRLPALAGIATMYSSTCDTPPGRYLCGLWTQDFPGALFWRAAAGAQLLPRSNTKIPSWSWASSTGPVEFVFTDDEVEKTQVLAVHVSCRGKDVMGDVTEAALQISGPVVLAKVFYGSHWRELATSRVGHSERSQGLEIGGQYATFAMDHTFENAEEHFARDSMPVMCLLLSSNHLGYNDPEHPETNREGQFACGLVLRPVSEQGAVYERIGYFLGWDLDDGFHLEELTSLSNKIQITLV
ncbi:heterokaryon incompatibility protein-domain-containing protein [Lasiosphaeria hispida]|uniref:Heterokaryon incompatibility protein-domain-containing protein n=1 Tax=Lasiosphaeria hispida TaxID=260671 RepID=A0AAJ0HKV8_9PEZI|nr:heterokaryon incompatibility protein-domain-containing protein [Lasiosphaeria hispida]